MSEQEQQKFIEQKSTNPVLWDEIQETIMIVGALAMWILFEYFCFLSEGFAGQPHVPVTRTALITIVTNLFTFKFTKSLPKQS